MKEIKQIFGIILVAFIIGYLLTFPYSLSYSGTDKIKLIQDSDITSLSQIINHKKFKNKVLYIKIWEPYDDNTENLSYLIKKYKGKNIAFIYLSYPDSDSNYKVDELLKWKTALKDLKLEGNHILMSSEFRNNLWKNNPKMGKNYLPHFLVVDKNGKIANFNAPSPEKKVLFLELDRLLEK